VKTGKLKAAKIEAKEIILVETKTQSQIKTTKPRDTFRPGIIIESPSNDPNAVATPLPPLNFKKIVQLCPRTELTAIRAQ